MKRSLVAVVVVGLLAGSLVSVAEAKKKPKPKKLVAAEQKFFLHWDSDGATPEGCTGAVYMSLEDKTGDSTCSDSTQAAQEVFIAAGTEDVVRYLFPAADGVPFTLDAARNLKGTMVLRGTYTYDAYVELVLTGMVDGAVVKLAEGATGKGQGALSNSAQGNQLPGPHAELPIDISFDTAYDKKQVTKLDLQVTIRGHHRGGIDYELNPSHIIVPTWK